MQTDYDVLFLEDEPTIREVLKEYMTISGYKVTTAERGDDAVELLKQKKFDAAVLDIMVPGKNGFEVLAYIRSHIPDMAVIMLTALDDEKTQVQAFNLYADDYIIKTDGNSAEADSWGSAAKGYSGTKGDLFAAGSVLRILQGRKAAAYAK